jgi:hypothetical protein
MHLADLTNQHDHTVVTDGVVAEQHMLAEPDNAAIVADKPSLNLVASTEISQAVVAQAPAAQDVRAVAV